jgi:hypothetical protein
LPPRSPLGNTAIAADEKSGGTPVDLELVVTVDVSRPMPIR